MLCSIEAVRRYVADKLDELDKAAWKTGGRPEHFLPLLGQKTALEELREEMTYDPEKGDQ